MLTDQQIQALDTREPDVRLCAHIAEVTKMATEKNEDVLFIIRIKGHMVLDTDEIGDDGFVHVEDHRLAVVEMALSPETWAVLADMVQEVTDHTVPIVPDNIVPPGDIARFLGSIPDIFRTRPNPEEN